MTNGEGRAPHPQGSQPLGMPALAVGGPLGHRAGVASSIRRLRVTHRVTDAPRTTAAAGCMCMSAANAATRTATAATAAAASARRGAIAAAPFTTMW